MTSATKARTEDQAPSLYYSSLGIRASGEATPAELLTIIKRKAPDPAVFEETPPFTWQAESSSGRLDSYFTRMDDKSLRNYVRDADDGVMFLDSHDKRQLGYGQSVRGQFLARESKKKLDEKNPDEDDVARVMIDFYTVPGVKLGRGDSDSFIRGVRAGLIRDVSIGFMPEAFECNLCGQDPFDWWEMRCVHVPGLYYDSTGQSVVTGRSQGAILAFAWVRNARLLEVSAVYDGATPGAFIQKAQWLMEAGQVDRAMVGVMERQLRVRLPAPPIIVPSFSINGGTLKLLSGSAVVDGARVEAGMEVPMGREGRFRRLSSARDQRDDDPAAEEVEAEETELEAAENVVADDGDAENSEQQHEEGAGDDPPAAEAENTEEATMDPEEERALREQAEAVKRARLALTRAGRADAETVDLETVVDEMAANIRDLTPRAALGDQYRKRTVDRALDAGVRAEGKDFDREGWEETFKAMKIEQIERMAGTWDKAGEREGGRRTAEVGTDPPPQGASKNGVASDPAQFISGR